MESPPQSPSSDPPSKKQALEPAGGPVTDAEEAAALERRQEAAEAGPSAKELAAAQAARMRLYGGPSSEAAELPELKLPSGVEPAAPPEVEYMASADLPHLPANVDYEQAILKGLQSPDWTTACAALTLLRRLAIHHKGQCQPLLSAVVPLVLKSVKSLRSSLSKTAIMAAADLFRAFGAGLLPLADIGGAARPAGSLLAALLAKASSNDKRFVIEEVEQTLSVMCQQVPPMVLLRRLLPYAGHKHPKTRAKVAAALAASAGRLRGSEWGEVEGEALLRTAAKFVADNTQEARAAGRSLLAELQAAYAARLLASGAKMEAEGKENVRECVENGAAEAPSAACDCAGIPCGAQAEKHNGWEAFCTAKLDKAVLGAALKASRLPGAPAQAAG